jgi:hypothetical protein
MCVRAYICYFHDHYRGSVLDLCLQGCSRYTAGDNDFGRGSVVY